MFDFGRRRRIAEEAAESWRVNFVAARNSANLWQAQLFHSWKVIAAQHKGLNRQRRLIRRLQAEQAVTKLKLADMTADYHRWHDAYMDLKYPGGSPRVASTSDAGAVTAPGTSP